MGVLANGFGDLIGDALLGAKPIQTSGNVWWVSSVNGVDAGGTAGQNREKPLATLAQAITNAAAADIIILKNGHAEVVTVQIAVNKALTIIGAGTTSGKPAASLTANVGAGTAMMSVTATGVELRNIYLPSFQSGNAGTRMTVTGSACRITGCYFDCGANDLGAALSLVGAASQHHIVNTTFISTATLTTAQPKTAISTTGAITDLTLDGCVFSDGTVGFSDDVAVNNSGGAMTQLKAQNISLLLGASFGTNWTGYLNVQTTTGGARS